MYTGSSISHIVLQRLPVHTILPRRAFSRECLALGPGGRDSRPCLQVLSHRLFFRHPPRSPPPGRNGSNKKMNCEVFSLSPLRCEPFQVKEVMRAVLHTILFSRTLGVVRPRDVDSELFDLTYATCGDPGVERTLEEKLDALVAWLQKQQQQQLDQQQHQIRGTGGGGRGGGVGRGVVDGNSEVQAQVCLSFFEKRDKGGWFGRQEERLYWEQWRVPLEMFTGEDAGMAER